MDRFVGCRPGRPDTALSAADPAAAGDSAAARSIVLHVACYDADGFKLVKPMDQATIQPGEARQLPGQAAVAQASIIEQTAGFRVPPPAIYRRLRDVVLHRSDDGSAEIVLKKSPRAL